MFSKSVIKHTLCYLILSFQLVACTFPFNEAPPEPSDLNAKLDGSQCLEGSTDALTKFVMGKGNPNEIIGFWDCLGSAVSSFEKSTRGRYEDRFTARELANFVERYFMAPNEKISGTLLLEIFKLKQLFIGGAVDSISRVEMKNALTVFDQLKRISLRVNPYMKVYSMNWMTTGDQNFESEIKYFEDANLEIQQASKDIADIIAKNGLAYKLDSFVVFLKEISAFDEQPWDFIADLEKAMPLVFKLKKALAGGKEGEIEPLEWRRFFLLGSRGYIQFLRYHYFINDATDNGTAQELVYVTRSIDDLFSYLGDMVDGKSEKNLSRAELLEILQALTRFVPKLKVSDPLLVEIMKIKSVFFGGRLDYFEKADFERARLKLETFRKLAEQFLKYAKVYTMNWKAAGLSPAEKLLYFREAEASLQNFAEQVGQNLEGRYDLNDLVKLAKELDGFYGEPNPAKETLEVRAKKMVPLLVVIKNIIFTDENTLIGNPSSVTIASALWKNFLGYASQGFSKFLYFNYFVKGQKISTGEGLENVEVLLGELTLYLETILSRKTTTNQQVTFAEFDKLWKALEQAGALPAKVTAASLASVTKALFQRLLITPERRLSGAKFNGMSKESLANLRTEFAIWSGVQRFNDWLYKGLPAEQGRPGSQVNAALAGSTAEGLVELKMIYGSGMDIALDAKGRLQITKPGAFYLRATADYINIIRAAARLIIRGYGENITRIKSYEGINVGEMTTLFADIKGLLVEMDMISPTNTTFAEARFRDGNLFSSVSNGNSYLDFKEAAHLTLMITSGLELNSMFYAHIEDQCRINNGSRYKDDWTIDFKCVTPIYKEKMLEYYSSMPDMVWFLKQMDKNRFHDFYMNLMKAAGYAPESGPLIKLGDLGQFTHVTQYVEMIFQVYDVNRDGFLNTAEAMKAFPTFKNILLEAAGGKLTKEKDLKGLFAWLLKYAKAPEGTVESIKFKIIWVPKGEKGWKVSADRERLAKILGFIADSTAAAAKKN